MRQVENEQGLRRQSFIRLEPIPGRDIDCAEVVELAKEIGDDVVSDQFAPFKVPHDRLDDESDVRSQGSQEIMQTFECTCAIECTRRTPGEIAAVGFNPSETSEKLQDKFRQFARSGNDEAARGDRRTPRLT